ncbi:MAG: hypothetical protein ACR2NN_28185, partial [Bryobacteraceae bacterium]
RSHCGQRPLSLVPVSHRDASWQILEPHWTVSAITATVSARYADYVLADRNAGSENQAVVRSSCLHCDCR